jgi:cephalosporin-C deacetylase-like acetyl esterase
MANGRTVTVLAGFILTLLTFRAANAQPAQAANDPNSPANLGRLELSQYLNNLAYLKTSARRVAVAELKNQSDAEVRQSAVRQGILRLIGGLPEKTPLNPRIVGSVQGDGFRIEKIIFESQPNFPVTAELYLPDGAPQAGKFPAVVVTPGHALQGKTADYSVSSNFARNGIAVLDYDPIGQGERLQYFDPQTGTTAFGATTGDHGEAGLQPTLIGDAVSRYFIWDAMRAIDYLDSRQEIDSNRIGAFGCSGGGTITAMLGGLEPRLKAIGVACFTTNFDYLLPSIGPQDAEQSIPGFIGSGFDIPDWAELAAPRPYAIIATYADMFPYPGAQQSENEIRRFYRLFGADDQLAFITGPGPHGNIQPLLPQILRFFLKYLRPADATAPLKLVQLPRGSSPFAPPVNLPKDTFQDTATGQLATALPHSESVHSLTLKHAQTVLQTRRDKASDLVALQHSIREVAKVVLQPNLTNDPSKAGYEAVSSVPDPAMPNGDGSTHFEQITIHVQQGIDLHGRMAWKDASNPHPAAVLLTNNASAISGTSDYDSLTARMRELVNGGNFVLALTPRPSPPGKESTKSSLLGDFYITGLRAELVDKTILGLRVDDTIRAVNYLVTRADVDRGHIAAYASYHLGLVLMHAAVLDPRLSQVTVDHALSSYRSLLDAPMPLHAPEDILPGVLLHYDIPDLVGVLGVRLTTKDALAGTDDLSPVPFPGAGS